MSRRAPVLLLLLLAGCAGATSSGYSCHNGDCKVSLHGEGADTDLGDELAVRLDDAGDGTAKVVVGGEVATLRTGQERRLAGRTVTLTKVDGDDVDLRIVS